MLLININVTILVSYLKISNIIEGERKNIKNGTRAFLRTRN